MRRIQISLIALAGMAGCSSQPQQPTHTVNDLLKDRSTYAVPSSTDRSDAIDKLVTDILSRPLTADSAVRLALLNNRGLAAQLAEVGISQADYLTAAQIKNPAIYVDLRPPDRRPPGGIDIEASATEDVLDILLLPLRKKMAQQQLDQAAIVSADAALQLVHDTRIAFYTLLAHQQELFIQKQETTAADAAVDFARRQHDAGNISDLDLANQQATDVQAKVEQIRAEIRVATDREKINRMMGLLDGQTDWTASDLLPAIPATEKSLDADVRQAEVRRLDIGAAAGQVAIANQALTYTRQGLLTSVNIGASMERETDGQTVVGPALSLELPIFNQHQGQIGRGQAELEQAKIKLQATRVTMQADIRLAAAQVNAARSIAELTASTLVPQRAVILSNTQLQYNGLLTGIYALLTAKQAQLEAQQEAVESLQDYWIARADWTAPSENKKVTS